MPAIVLTLRYLDYVTDLGRPVRAWRAYADVRFPVVGGGTRPVACIIDSGAPFSVLPYSLWSDTGLAWTPSGRSLLTPSSARITSGMTWQGQDCDLGVVEVDVVDPNIRAGPFLVVAKFVRRRHPQPAIENTALLGMNFILDNWLRLEVDASREPPVGRLEWPD